MIPIRGQNDGLNDEISLMTGLFFDPLDESSRMITRQEFKDDADINKLISKFGVDAFTKGRQAIPGAQINYDLDLQQALTTVNAVQQRYNFIPQWLKDRYPNWQLLAEALESGTIDLKEPQAPPAPPTPEEAAELASLREARKAMSPKGDTKTDPKS